MATTRVYRAVGENEYQQILRTGRFELGHNSLGGKHFSDTIAGARAYGERFYGAGDYHLVEADVPDDAPSLIQWPNLDQKGPARFLAIDDLKDVTPHCLD